MRVVTLNHWGRHGDWPRRRDVLRAGFAELDADLIALQETVVADGTDTVQEILGAGYHVVHQGRRAPNGAGMSIATRVVPDRVEEVDLLVTERVDVDDMLGRATLAELTTDVGRVLFVHHKPSWQLPFEVEREQQAVGLARAIETWVEDRPAHVVLAGDFDARPDSASIRFWTGRQSLDRTSVHYLDVWETVGPVDGGHTFTPDNPLIDEEAEWSRIPPRRIDYLMVRCDEHGPTLRVEHAQRVFDAPVEGVWATDHVGVLADLTL